MLKSFIISLAIGLIIWMVLPHFLGGFFKNKSGQKGMALLCKIIGIVVIVLAAVDLVTSLF